MGPNESRNLWISLGAGIFAAFLLYSYSQEKKAALEKSAGDKVRVVVARSDIREMETIYDDALEIKEKSREEVEPDYFDSIPTIVGTVAAIPLKKGQTITKNAVMEPGPDTGLAITVSPGKRGVTIPVTPERANAKLIRPGDRVDVFALIESGRGLNTKREVSLLSQDITVLATGVNVHNQLPRTVEKDPTGKNLMITALTGDSKYDTITLEVKANEAQDLIYLAATNPGSIILVVRNPNDRKPLERIPASSSESIQSRTSVLPAGPTPQAAPNFNGVPGR